MLYMYLNALNLTLLEFMYLITINQSLIVSIWILIFNTCIEFYFISVFINFLLTNLPSNVLLMRSLNLSLLSEVKEEGVCISTCCFSSIRQSSHIWGLSKFLADPSSSPLISLSCSRVSTDFWNTGGNMSKFKQYVPSLDSGYWQYCLFDKVRFKMFRVSNCFNMASQYYLQ